MLTNTYERLDFIPYFTHRINLNYLSIQDFIKTWDKGGIIDADTAALHAI